MAAAEGRPQRRKQHLLRNTGQTAEIESRQLEVRLRLKGEHRHTSVFGFQCEAGSGGRQRDSGNEPVQVTAGTGLAAHGCGHVGAGHAHQLHVFDTMFDGQTRVVAIAIALQQ